VAVKVTLLPAAIVAVCGVIDNTQAGAVILVMFTGTVPVFLMVNVRDVSSIY
jgi:hypothetical protein